jgi:hypothetical protein
LYFSQKNLKFKKTQKNPFLVGFFRWVFLGFFGWVFLGGFFIANPAYATDWLLVEVALLLIGLSKISWTKSGFDHPSVLESPRRAVSGLILYRTGTGIKKTGLAHFDPLSISKTEEALSWRGQEEATEVGRVSIL